MNAQQIKIFNSSLDTRTLNVCAIADTRLEMVLDCASRIAESSPDQYGHRFWQALTLAKTCVDSAMQMAVHLNETNIFFTLEQLRAVVAQESNNSFADDAAYGAFLLANKAALSDLAFKLYQESQAPTVESEPEQIEVTPPVVERVKKPAVVLGHFRRAESLPLLPAAVSEKFLQVSGHV